MNLPIDFHPRLNTQDVLNKLSLGPARRILLDKSGESKRPPFTNFNDLVTHHAIQKRKAEAEGLYVAEKMRLESIVGPRTSIQRTGAVLQTFRGVTVEGRRDRDMQACHTIPFQALFDSALPYFLHAPDGMQLTHKFQHRNMLLYARCDWQPRTVNEVDSALEGSSGFVADLYLTALEAVIAGNTADDVYRDYSKVKGKALSGLRDKMNDDSFVTLDVPMQPKRRDTKQTVESIRDQLETIIEIYTEQERVSPRSVATGDLILPIASEKWLMPATDRSRSARS